MLLGVAADAFYRAGELIVTANWEGARTFLDGARHDIEDQLRTDDEAALSMSARVGDRQSADGHLVEDQDIPVQVGP